MTNVNNQFYYTNVDLRVSGVICLWLTHKHTQRHTSHSSRPEEFWVVVFSRDPLDPHLTYKTELNNTFYVHTSSQKSEYHGVHKVVAFTETSYRGGVTTYRYLKMINDIVFYTYDHILRTL